MEYKVDKLTNEEILETMARGQRKLYDIAMNDREDNKLAEATIKHATDLAIFSYFIVDKNLQSEFEEYRSRILSRFNFGTDAKINTDITE